MPQEDPMRLRDVALAFMIVIVAVALMPPVAHADLKLATLQVQGMV